MAPLLSNRPQRTPAQCIHCEFIQMEAVSLIPGDVGEHHYLFYSLVAEGLLCNADLPASTGARVWEQEASTFQAPLHPSLPSDLHYLPGRNQDWSNNLNDYLLFTFSRPCTVYIIINTLANEPKWLREHFFKLRDPNYAEVHLKIRINLNWSEAMQLAVSGVYSSLKTSTMRVFKSKRVYQAGDSLVLPGPGLAYLADTLYLVAFQTLEPGARLHAPRLSDRSDPGVPSQCATIRRVVGFTAPAADGTDTPMSGQEEDADGTAAANGDDASQGTPVKGATMSRLKSMAGLSVRPSSAGGGPEADPVFSGCMMSYHDAWFPKLIKYVKRGRLADVRRIVSSDLLLPENISFLQNYDITFLIPGEFKELLTVELAVKNGHLEMLCILVSQCGCAMSYPALKFLVHHWEEVPAQYGSAMQILANYICQHPAPLAVICAFMRAIRFEIQQRVKRKPAAELEAALADLQRLQLLVLQELQEVQRRVGADSTEVLPRLQRILDPQLPPEGQPGLLSELPPLKLALEDNDVAFMNASLVSSYMSNVWLGAEYVLETCKDSSSAVTLLDPRFAYQTLIGLGFAPPDLPTLDATQRMFFVLTWGQQAYFNSPRVRWAMHLLGVVLYLLVFIQVVGAAVLPQWSGNATEEGWLDAQTITASLFILFTFGNIIDTTRELLTRYHGNLIRFIRRNPGTFLYLLIDMLLFALSCIYGAMHGLLSKGNTGCVHLCVHLLLLLRAVLVMNEQVVVDPDTMRVMTMVWASQAPFVCGRLLYTLVPVITSLGPMLHTMKGMVQELFIFMLPWAFITIGFGIALRVIYSDMAGVEEGQVAVFGSFWDTLFVLLQGFTDKLDFTIFDDMPTVDLRAYGKAIFMLYTLSNGLLLGNLLIAIITYRYKPEEVQAQTALNMAHIIDDHKHQVDTHWLTSPWSVFQCIMVWLPGGTRQKLHMHHFFKLGLPFLDGFRAASGTLYPTLPTGRYEIPHLIYLLTLHPLIMATWLACFTLHVPVCLIYFTIQGYRKLYAECRAVMGIGSFNSRNFDRGQQSMYSPSMSASSWAASSVSGSKSIAVTSSSASLDQAEVSILGAPAPASLRLRDLGSWQGWAGLLRKSALLVVNFCLGLVICVVLNTLSLVLLALHAWLGAVLWSLFNIIRGLVEPFVEVLYPSTPQEGGPTCSAAAFAASAGGDVASSQPGWFASSKIAPSGTGRMVEVDLPDLDSGADTLGDLEKQLHMLFTTSRAAKASRDPAQVELHRLQDLLVSVFGTSLRLNKTYTKPRAKAQG